MRVPGWIWFFILLWLILVLFDDRCSCSCKKDDEEDVWNKTGIDHKVWDNPPDWDIPRRDR